MMMKQDLNLLNSLSCLYFNSQTSSDNKYCIINNYLQGSGGARSDNQPIQMELI